MEWQNGQIDCIKIDWSKFTAKQRKAISGYIRTGSKVGAYSAAYDSKTNNKKTIQKGAKVLFDKPHIKAVIEQIQSYAVRKANLQMEQLVDGCINELIEEQKEFLDLSIDAAWVLRRLAMLADFNIRTFIRTDDHGNAIYDFSEATDDDWYCIQEYVSEELQRGQGDDKYLVDKIKVKGYDKLRALELVGKHVDVQAFKDQADLNITGTMTHRTLDDFYDDSAKSAPIGGIDADAGEDDEA